MAAIHLEPITSREVFAAFLEHGLEAAGTKGSIVADSARELIFRATGGLPCDAAKLVRAALRIAHERQQNFIDETTIEACMAEGAL